MICEFINEFNRIKKVVESCETQEQYDNATRWAKNWCMRMCVAYPNVIKDCNKLYEEIVS